MICRDAYQEIIRNNLVRSIVLPYMLSLISTHTFRLPPAKFLAFDMRKLVKPIELDEETFAPFTFVVQINITTSVKFSCSETNQIYFLSHLEPSQLQKKFTKWPPKDSLIGHQLVYS